ncbi:MAG TPA: response regulator, partial [Verrucomicrobiae bacterium]|nr:response regulator [Verrucomicrobiae bacterium]
KKILLVEDEPVAKSLYQNRLQSEGFAVSVAVDGEGALSELSKAQADLVVLDLTLPKMNGEEAVKKIRANNSLKTTPVLIISNAYMGEMSQKAMESGATRGLLKTECTPARLVETVRDLLGFRSAFELTNSPVNDDKTIKEFSDAAEKALADELKLKETREEFIKKAPADITRIRELCRAYVKSGQTPAASEPLGNLYQQVRFFATRAGLSGCVPIALVANAFEALLFDVLFKPSRATPSIAQTFAQAVDCLERLCQAKDGGVREIIPRARILVVDDDPVCNLAMVAALKRAHFEPVAVEDPTKVIPMAKSNQYDIVMLDINMPDVNGFELCKGLRSMPQYKETPVIFITANADFQNRAQSILSGGNDVIPKPVSPLELVLKVTMRLLLPQGAPADGGQRAAAQNSAPAKEMPPAAASAPVTAPKEAAPAAPATPAPKTEPGEIKPPAAQPPLEIAAKKETSFSTEMLKKAWSADRPETPPNDAKAPLSKNETARSPEPVKLDPSAVSIGPLKMASDEPPKYINGTDKSEELKDSKIELPQAEAPKIAAAKVEAPYVAVPKAEVPKVEPKVEAAKAETPKVEPKVEAPKVEAPKVEAKTEAPKAEPKVEVPAPAVAEAKPAEPKPAAKPHPEPQPPSSSKKPHEPKPAEKPATAKEPPISHAPKPQHTNTTMETTKKPTLDEAARGVARIIFGDENLNDMNVRLTRIALEKYNVPGTQKLDDVARGVSQIIFGDDKVSEMNVRLTRIALERYNVADVLHLNGSNGANGAA